MVHNMVHDSWKNTVEVQVFFGGACMHQKPTQGNKILCTKFQILEALYKVLEIQQITIKYFHIKLWCCLLS